MADAQSASKRSGLTRGKALLIGVLAVVLVGVLYMQFGAFRRGAELRAGGLQAAPPSADADRGPDADGCNGEEGTDRERYSGRGCGLRGRDALEIAESGGRR